MIPNYFQLIIAFAILGIFYLNMKFRKAIVYHSPGDYAKARKSLYVKEREKISYYSNQRFCNWVNKNYDGLYELWQDDFYGIVCFDTFCISAFFGKLEIVMHTSRSHQLFLKIQNFLLKIFR